MATPNPTRLPLTERLPLLAWVVVLSAIVVGAVVGVAEFDDAWAVAVAGAAALAATLTIILVVRDELAEDDELAATRVLGVRRVAAALGVTAGAALAIAVVATTADAGDSSMSTATAATAVRTARDFVVAAAIDQNGEEACGFLTPAEQASVGASAGGACRQVFADGSFPTPGGATTEGAVRRLPAAVSVRDGEASVRLGTGDRAVTFLLERATPTDQNEFNAPASAWRIASGATSRSG
jgi:hypothetical protein